MKSAALIFLLFSLNTSLGLAKNINCLQFADILDKTNTDIKIQNKNLKQSSKQIESNKVVINNYNKNCRNASGANCNSAMYDMIISQMPLLAGQQSQTESKISNLKTLASEANENFISCKNAVKIQK